MKDMRRLPKTRMGLSPLAELGNAITLDVLFRCIPRGFAPLQ